VIFNAAHLVPGVRFCAEFYLTFSLDLRAGGPCPTSFIEAAAQLVLNFRVFWLLWWARLDALAH
jgi:hypothetical protein